MKKSIIALALGSGTGLLCSPLYAQTPSDIEVLSVVSSRIGIADQAMASSVTVLTEDDIAALGNLTLTDILRQTPSVGVSNSGGLGKLTTLRIRGEEGFRTKLFIDDVEITDPSAPQIAPVFDDLLSSHISRIEILRGVQGLTYGADAGGIVRVYSRQAEEGTSAGLAVETGKFDTQTFSGNAGWSNKTSGVSLSATSLETDGFNAQSSDVSGEHDGYDNTTVHLSGWTQLTDALRLSGVFRSAEGDNEYDGCFDNSTFAPTNNCLTESQQRTARIALDYQQDNQQHQLAVSRTKIERDFINNGEFGFQNAGSQEQASYLGAIELNQTNLAFGAEYEREEIDTTGESRNQKSLFTQWQQSFSQGVSTHVGVRYDDNETFGSFTSYRVGGRYPVAGSGVTFKAGLGTGFRAPSLFEQAYNDGPFSFGDAAGLQLNEEQSQGWDLGFEFRNNTGFEAELVYFNQQIEDEILFDNAAFQGYLQAQGESESRGVELSVEHTVNSHWYWWGNYTYNDTETVTGEPRLRRPKHKANLGLTSTWLNSRLQVTTSVRSVRDAVDIGGVALDDYTLVNANLRYQATMRMAFNLRAENLTDRDYQEVAGFNSAERALYAGISLNY